MTFLLPLVALLAATALPVQAALNAQLARGVGNPILAGAISFAAAAILLTAIVGLFVRDYPSAAQLGRVPLWLFGVGGALGAVYVCANIVLVPRLGAATLIAFAIAGQLIAALRWTSSACSASPCGRSRSGASPAWRSCWSGP